MLCEEDQGGQGQRTEQEILIQFDVFKFACLALVKHDEANVLFGDMNVKAAKGEGKEKLRKPQPHKRGAKK